MRGAWYGDGLCFECTRCGNCCSGFSGTVAVNDAEISTLARRLEVEEERFRRDYTRVLPDRSISLREKPDYDCVFYDKRHGCMVYEDRPRQCRTWPFWRANVGSPGRWTEEAASCPGMNRGRLYTFDEIESFADTTP